MSTQNDNIKAEKNLVLDVIFSSILALLVIVFFIDGLRYHPVAIRAPLVAMIPLGILLVINLVRVSRGISLKTFKVHTQDQVGEEDTQLKKLIVFIIWIMIFGFAIYLIGHYAGVLFFLIFFLRFMSKEKWWVSVVLAVGLTFVIYLLFEALLGIQLYRGLVYMFWRGYQIF